MAILSIQLTKHDKLSYLVSNNIKIEERFNEIYWISEESGLTVKSSVWKG